MRIAEDRAIDEAIQTVQFIRNKAIRYWMDNRGTRQNDLQKLCTQLAQELPFTAELNSMARFYQNCQKNIPEKKGFPAFGKNNPSVEYKTSGWKLAENRKAITFTDKKGKDAYT